MPESLPTRGAWIETRTIRCSAPPIPSRSPRGERRLKLVNALQAQTNWGSLPTRGAWIETDGPCSTRAVSAVAPHAGSVD